MKEMLAKCYDRTIKLSLLKYEYNYNSYEYLKNIMEKAMNCRTVKSFFSWLKKMDEVACELPNYSWAIDVLTLEDDRDLICDDYDEDDEEDDFDIHTAIELAKAEFESADPRAVMKTADIYTCGSDKMIIKFNFCEFDFEIDIDYTKHYAEMTYALAGYESEFMFGIPTMNAGYNFLTGKIETKLRKLWPTELLAMVLKNMSRNGYIAAYIEEANLEEEFTQLMNDDDAHNKLIMF